MSNQEDLPDIPWVAAADNPWGVPLLDVRPVTLNMLSSSADQRCAENAISFQRDDGTGFIGQQPKDDRTIETNLEFPIDRVLADGVLFIPNEMENKWALFYHNGEIICVRSWLREVQAVAQVEERGDHVCISQIRGTMVVEEEEPDFTARFLDCLLRTHALRSVYPVPLPVGMEESPRDAALWCMSVLGNRAIFATPHKVAWERPDRPLRTHSMLHISVARGETAAIEKHLAAGVPIDLLAADGLTPLHWSLAREDLEIVALLLERGSPVDVRSAQGATALMNAVQARSLDKANFLLDHGADVNAQDARGFTALHRAAEMGEIEIARLLLERGAFPNPEADGHTPRSLAESQERMEIVDLLGEYQ